MSKKTIALIGNPNCGKTTLFNGLTGGKIQTGNWPGVTVEKREGTFTFQGNEITVVDLPGIYSFSAHSQDEKVARDYALSGEPAMILNIIDATNLERNLYLTTQLIEMKVPVVVVVNMIDIAEKQGIKINLDDLSKKLTLPVVGISAILKKDVERVKTDIEKSINKPVLSGVKVEYANEVEDAIAGLQTKVTATAKKMSIDSRWIAIKLLENDTWIKDKVITHNELSDVDISAEQKKIEKILGDTPDIICADYRYGFIHGISQNTVKRIAARRTMTDKIDKVVLNRVLGIPIFLVIMYLVFWVTITIGGAFIDFFDILFGTIFVDGFGTLLGNIGASPWFIAILAGGIGAGIQTVATFIPIIFMLFLMLSLLEDSGYMARAAFVMDRFMKLLGLPGKSFVPLLVGFGCTVPAVMAARTLESKRDRFLTIFMAPFMSCGARLPVYALFVAAFFPFRGGLVVFSLYAVGIIFSVLSGLLMKKILFRGEVSYFIMELPPYHRPRIRHILIHTWDRLKSFIIRAGKMIIIVVALLGFFNSMGTDCTFGNENTDKSVLALIGKTITPVFEPMGVEKENWPATVGIFTGLFAKEAVVGTLNSLYGQMAVSRNAAHTNSKAEKEEVGFNFWGGIREAFVSIPRGLSGVFEGLADPFGVGIISGSDGEAMEEEIGVDTGMFTLIRSYFSKGGFQAYAYLLFILLYFPCVAALGTIIKETNGWFGALSAFYLTILGWISATLFYQITAGHQILWIIIPLAVTGLMVLGLYLLRNVKIFKLQKPVSLCS
jgi:ferrous iron transport protein B